MEDESPREAMTALAQKTRNLVLSGAMWRSVPWAERFRFPGVAALVLAFWPVWRWYAARLDDGADEPWGLAALATAAVLLWRDRARLRVDGAGLALSLLCAVAYAVLAWWGSPPLLRAVCAVGCLWAALGGRHAPAGVAALAVWSLPVLASARFFLDWPLRLSVAEASRWVLAAMGEEATREGTVLWSGGVPVTVDAPCSGVQMLWSGLAFFFVVASVRRLSWGVFLLCLPLMVAAIWLANVARAAVLFFPESGRVAWPEWTHSAIGLACFAALIWGMLRWLPEGRAAEPLARAGSTGWIPLWGAVLLTALIGSIAASKGQGDREAPDFPGFPARWQGEELRPIPLSPAEQRFARAFPGHLAAFATVSGRRVILRWVAEPTRQLHSSADCLRAEGYLVEGGPASRYASHPQRGRFRVREVIWEADRSSREWLEVSPWYWDALLGRSQGPWWAGTVIEPVLQR